MTHKMSIVIYNFFQNFFDKKILIFFKISIDFLPVFCYYTVCSRKCRNWQTSKTKDLVINAIVWVQVPSSALISKQGNIIKIRFPCFLFFINFFTKYKYANLPIQLLPLGPSAVTSYALCSSTLQALPYNTLP